MHNFRQQLQQYWQLRWLRRSIISISTITIILLLIPVIIQYSIPYLLVKQGASKAQIEDINLNLFAGTFELKNLVITTGENTPTQLTRLYTDVNMLDLFSSKIIVHKLNIEGLDLTVKRHDDGTIAINGLIIPVAKENKEKQENVKTETESTPVAFGVDHLIISNSYINYQETDFEQKSQLKSITLSNLKSWDEASSAEVNIDTILNKAPFKLNAQLNLFSKVKQFKGHASLSTLSFTPYEKFYRDYLNQLQGNISLESDFDISLAENISAIVENQINIADINVAYKDISQSVKNISWTGQTSFNEKAELLVKGDLQIDKSLTIDHKQNYKISSFDQLTLKALQKGIESINFEQLKINNILLIDQGLKDQTKEKQFVSLDLIDITEASFLTNSTELKVKQVALENPAINIELTSQKELAQLLPLLKTIENLQPEQPQKAEEKKEEHPPTEPMLIDIQQLILNKPGMINFSDLSVSPNYQTRVHLNTLDINNISSVNPANFNIALKQEEYTTFDVSGSGLLFDPTKSLNMTANIKQLDLPPVTPYSSNAMGYGMKSGVIDSDIKMKLENRNIDSNVNLKIDSIEVVETDKGTAEEVSSASGMSIDLAISTLKDSDNIIELELPIKGNIDKPDFDLSKVINKAMGKAMQSASLSYLKQAFQPFGSLITLYSLAKKAADHITLPPLQFKPNSLDFKDQQQEMMDKVIRVLNDRPALKIKACGVSALEDQQLIKKRLIEQEVARLEAINKAALEKSKTDKNKTEVKAVNPEEIVIDEKLIQQKMKELADSRAAKVKAFFLEQGKLKSNRILNCLSTSNTEEESQPSVELLI